MSESQCETDNDPVSGTEVTNLVLESPLYSSILREWIWLNHGSVTKEVLDNIIDRNITDLSILKTIKGGNAATVGPTKTTRRPQDGKHGKQLRLYSDLQWSLKPEYYWPIKVGDYSPLSPDGEPLERHGKIGLDFWRWHRESAPLGYVPPLCTCKRTDGCMKMLYKYISNRRNIDVEHLVCNNDVCRGLLYIPFSLLEIPLNRYISNGSEFVAKVQIPNSTDVYCGNMKHTIILCTTDPEHETQCLDAIYDCNIAPPLIYDVVPTNFLPYFKRFIRNSYTNTPIMTVEPIDSDISEESFEFGLGQIFAIKDSGNELLINKFDTNLKKVIPLDCNLKFRWLSFNKIGNKECETGEEGTSDITDDDKQSPLDITSPINTPPTDTYEPSSSKDVPVNPDDYILYELIESFSSDRRPLTFKLRSNKRKLI